MSEKSATLGYLAGLYRCQIVFDCQPCRRRAQYMATEAAVIFGEQTTLNQLKRRIVCKECGAKIDGDLRTLNIGVTENRYHELRKDGFKVGGY